MELISNIRTNKPLIHCITNTVAINDCANALLAVGARPVMAEHPDEAAEFTSAANALLINTGTIYKSKTDAMQISAAKAGDRGIPYILDCVGAMSSSVRRELIGKLIRINMPAVIKGNAAEISAACGGAYSASGVDAEGIIDYNAAATAAKRLGTVIMVTGAEDFITDGEKTVTLKNGDEKLSRVTGTGCMLGCLTAAFAAVTDAFNAAKYSAALMGISGERASDARGLGTFRVRLMDELSFITDEILLENIKEV